MFFDNKIFKLWHDKGILYFEQCYSNGTLMSFEQLKTKYDLSNKHFFCYLQLRTFLKKSWGDQMTLPDLTKVEKIFYNSKGPKHFIRQVYLTIMEEYPKQNIHQSRERWESDLGITIHEDLWSDLCQNSLFATIIARFKLVNYNFLHQLYLTPQKLHRYNPSISNICFRCGIAEDTMIHCTWQCTKVTTFWYDICDTLTKITATPIPLDPGLCLLGNTTNFKLSQSSRKLIDIAFTVSRKCVALTWKSDSSLSISKWISEMMTCLPFEKITYVMRNRYDTFLKIWQPFIDYIETTAVDSL